MKHEDAIQEATRYLPGLRSMPGSAGRLHVLKWVTLLFPNSGSVNGVGCPDTLEGWHA